MLTALAAALIVAVLAGGRLGRLARLRLKYEAAIVLLFIAQGIVRGRPILSRASNGWTTSLWALIGLVLMILLWQNRQLPGVAVIVMGFFMNLWVTMANGRMPVTASRLGGVGFRDAFYSTPDSTTSLVWMGDVLPDPSGTFLLSVGDLLLFVGLVTLVVHAAVTPTHMRLNPDQAAGSGPQA